MCFKNPNPSCSRTYRTGFSLVELMVVLVIIALLAGVVTLNVRGYLVKAKADVARADISTVSGALETFYTLHDRYPTNEEGLEVLATPTPRMSEPLLNKVPKDPWGRAYVYNSPGRETPYEVMTLGADGREGGEGTDADIGSWEAEATDAAP